MTLFQNDGLTPKRRGTGVVFLALAIVIGVVGLGLLPTPYIIERPGPALNVLGEVDGTKVISIADTETYPTDGALDLLTVSVVGNREQTPNWIELFAAWIDPKQSITPIDEVFPIGQTSEEAAVESYAMMEQSQQDAIYVSLNKLGYKIPVHIYIQTVMKNSPAAGKLVAGDYIEAVNGVHANSQPELRALLDKYNGKTPLDVKVLRKGKILHIDMHPIKDSDGRYMFGIMIGYKYDFPVAVKLELSDVGGPSGGMIFALGIYDQLTPGALTGGQNIAGTGTISTDGTVGPIGGIRQKLYSALSVGAKYFLAPKANCNEVVGQVPDGLKVYSVGTYEEALKTVKAIASKSDLTKLPTCSASN